MSKLVLIGGGGHCKSILDSLLEKNMYNDVVIVDPDIPVGTSILGCRVVGNDDMLPILRREGYHDAFVAVGGVKESKLRCKLEAKLVKNNFHLINIVDPTAVIGRNCTLGKGIFVGKNAIINAGCRIGNMSIINTCAVVEHECTVEEYVHVSVGSVLCGNVFVGKNSFVGSNSTVIQGVRVNESSIIGAGSIVLKEVPAFQTVYGIFKG